MSRAQQMLEALIPPVVGSEIVIKGYRYVIDSVKPFEFQGRQRFECFVKKPKGKVHYYVVRYESGAWSDPVSFGR